MIAIAHVLFTALLAGAAQAAPVASASAVDACTLLTAPDVQRVQQTIVKDTKSSSNAVKNQHYAQCVFATADIVNSVSVTWITGGVPEAWSRFKNAKTPPRRVESVGREALWAGDAKAGSLYVLTDAGILRVSVGGVADPAERLRRSQALAAIAVKRVSSQ